MFESLVALWLKRRVLGGCQPYNPSWCLCHNEGPLCCESAFLAFVSGESKPTKSMTPPAYIA